MAENNNYAVSVLKPVNLNFEEQLRIKMIIIDDYDLAIRNEETFLRVQKLAPALKCPVREICTKLASVLCLNMFFAEHTL